MHKSVLVEIIRSLDKKEVRELRKWLHSPAHNQREDAVELFEYLVKNASNGEAAVEKERVWKALFPKQPFDDAFMRQIMYFLLKAVEDYFIFHAYKKETVRPLISLAALYRIRHLDKPFRQAIEAAKKAQTASPVRDSNFHLDKFFLEEEIYFYNALQQRPESTNLQEVSDELDIAYVANKLRITCRSLSHQSVDKTAVYNIGMLNDLLSNVEVNPVYLDTPAIAVYYYIYKTFVQPDQEAYFDAIAAILKTKADLFPQAEQRELYFHALNYCIRRINAGKEPFFRRAFELYSRGFEEEILFEENGSISRFAFGNAVQSALKIKEFDWAEQFIQNQQHRLEEKYRNSVVPFNLSRLYFEKGDYRKAMEYLTRFEYDDMLLNLIAKTMLLKIYYEQDELDAFESLLEAMRTYMQRKEALDQTRKTAYKNTIALMKKLLHTNPYSKSQVEKLRQQIQTTQPLMERDWLLNQAALLRK